MQLQKNRMALPSPVRTNSSRSSPLRFVQRAEFDHFQKSIICPNRAKVHLWMTISLIDQQWALGLCPLILPRQYLLQRKIPSRHPWSSHGRHSARVFQTGLEVRHGIKLESTLPVAKNKSIQLKRVPARTHFHHCRCIGQDFVPVEIRKRCYYVFGFGKHWKIGLGLEMNSPASGL